MFCISSKMLELGIISIGLGQVPSMLNQMIILNKRTRHPSFMSDGHLTVQFLPKFPEEDPRMIRAAAVSFDQAASKKVHPDVVKPDLKAHVAKSVVKGWMVTPQDRTLQ